MSSPADEIGDAPSTPPCAIAPAHGASKAESATNSRWVSIIRVKKVCLWIQQDIEQVTECKEDVIFMPPTVRFFRTGDQQPELLHKCFKVVLLCDPGVTNIALSRLEKINFDKMCPPARKIFSLASSCKRKTPGRMKGINLQPSSYTATDYVPSKPEYLPVDYFDAEDPVPAKLQFYLLPLLLPSLPGTSRSRSKRKATDTLELPMQDEPGQHGRRSRCDRPDGCLYTAEMFVVNLGVSHLLHTIVFGSHQSVFW
ncbi:uncharacterized protein F5891DRAFT_986520 [Suillus fuscotomentosus]|uniref:Uncharacterized protein n=1 Tax=Suillus fuscotomentosus TaxID=1912939 RepID=A0AAD4DS25_9AGAM|nr:uncharacterized protein F5891DRAFT_986520 [Suillus fuscotomentosus]KAG1891819.1 hypothetical protein F5891DRAFT_986520 [Suillus fuscotomentosus]